MYLLSFCSLLSLSVSFFFRPLRRPSRVFPPPSVFSLFFCPFLPSLSLSLFPSPSASHFHRDTEPEFPEIQYSFHLSLFMRKSQNSSSASSPLSFFGSLHHPSPKFLSLKNLPSLICQCSDSSLQELSFAHILISWSLCAWGSPIPVSELQLLPTEASASENGASGCLKSSVLTLLLFCPQLNSFPTTNQSWNSNHLPPTENSDEISELIIETQSTSSNSLTLCYSQTLNHQPWIPTPNRSSSSKTETP